jgi:hypothetical protein
MVTGAVLAAPARPIPHPRNACRDQLWMAGQDQPAQQIAEVVGDELVLPDADNPLCG